MPHFKLKTVKIEQKLRKLYNFETFRKINFLKNCHNYFSYLAIFKILLKIDSAHQDLSEKYSHDYILYMLGLTTILWNAPLTWNTVVFVVRPN